MDVEQLYLWSLGEVAGDTVQSPLPEHEARLGLVLFFALARDPFGTSRAALFRAFRRGLTCGTCVVTHQSVNQHVGLVLKRHYNMGLVLYKSCGVL